MARRCALCGGPTVALLAAAPHGELSAARLLVLDDWAAARWLQSYDAAWIGEDWGRLERCLAHDIRFLPRGQTAALEGRAAVVAHLREYARRVRMHEYNATDVTGCSSGPVGVIDYRWQLDGTQEREHVAASGRDVLVLRAADDDWELVWCAQFPS